MVQGMIVNSFTGRDGEITIPGLGAVVGIMHKWTLQRSEERTSGTPKWTLQAVLSYVNPSLMANDLIEKSFTCVLNKTTKIKLCEYTSIKLEGTQLVVEGVVQCQ
jgi:hypothetical protein